MTNSAVRLLEYSAIRYYDKIAIDDGENVLTYKDYYTAALRIGAGILTAGGESKDPVVVFLEKGASMLISFMGVLFAGRPYAPVAAASPASRLEKIIDSLKPGFILTSASLVGKLDDIDLKDTKIVLFETLLQRNATPNETEHIRQVVSDVKDTDPAYIIYTSGSTGTPKGVTQTHRGIIKYAKWLEETFHYDQDTVMANQAPFYFDNSVLDIYGCLQCGGKLCIIPEKLFMFPNKLPEYLRDNNVTSILWVPTVMINVANSGELGKFDIPSLKTVCFAGEVMPNTQLNIWRKALPNCTYANLYGPTETDVCCYYIVDREFKDSDSLPIGKLCEMFDKLELVKEDGTVAAKGEEGEIVITGDGVALGYWNAPELTEKAFSGNTYKTGDLAYENERGELIFCGRKDNQIKVKGNRIELGEIEAAAMCIKGVENACAVFDQEKEEIVLFIETKEEFTLRRFNVALKDYILGYMLPAKLVCMEKLPHTPNDKIDRVTLKGMI